MTSPIKEFPTPRTDSEYFVLYGDTFDGQLVRAEFARQLEREIAASKALNDMAIDLLQDAFMIAKREGLGTDWESFKLRIYRYFDRISQ